MGICHHATSKLRLSLGPGKTLQHAAAGLCLSLLAGVSAQADAQPGREQAFHSDAQFAIPGPRDCFWMRGPFSADPYVNIAYPDANVYYWAGVFTTPPGAKLELVGEYPRSRYVSFTSYDARGRPMDALPDFLIEADAGPNPYESGASRISNERGYSLEVVPRAREVQREVGSRESTGDYSRLYAPPYGKGQQQTMLYRIYLPDSGTEPTAGVSLPAVRLTLANGDVLKGEAACKALRTRQPALLAPDAAGISAGTYRELINQPDKPDTWPAQNPATWHIQLDRKSLLGIYTGEINEDARRSGGGFYPNPDNFYIRTIVNRRHGPVFLIRAKAPTTPETAGGDERMGSGDLRYWSICSNQSFVNTRVNDCLYDEEIPTDARGYFTVVVSRPDDRPRNATRACGIGWLPMAADGDGMFDKDVTVVQLRHMLPAADFEHSIDRIESQNQMEAVLGDYMPQTRYLQTNQVEAFFPCPGA